MDYILENYEILYGVAIMKKLWCPKCNCYFGRYDLFERAVHAGDGIILVEVDDSEIM